MLKIAALIVTYNPDTEVLAKLIELLKTSRLDLKIYLADNASNNAQHLKDEYLSDHDYTFLSENLGLAGAQNILLKKLWILIQMQYFSLIRIQSQLMNLLVLYHKV